MYGIVLLFLFFFFNYTWLEKLYHSRRQAGSNLLNPCVLLLRDCEPLKIFQGHDIYQLFIFSDGRKFRKVQCCQLQSYYETSFEAKFNSATDLIRNAVNVMYVSVWELYILNCLQLSPAVQAAALQQPPEMFSAPYSQCLQPCPANGVQPTHSWVPNAFLQVTAGSPGCPQESKGSPSTAVCVYCVQFAGPVPNIPV